MRILVSKLRHQKFWSCLHNLTLLLLFNVTGQFSIFKFSGYCRIILRDFYWLHNFPFMFSGESISCLKMCQGATFFSNSPYSFIQWISFNLYGSYKYSAKVEIQNKCDFITFKLYYFAEICIFSPLNSVVIVKHVYQVFDTPSIQSRGLSALSMNLDWD